MTDKTNDVDDLKRWMTVVTVNASQHNHHKVKNTINVLLNSIGELVRELESRIDTLSRKKNKRCKPCKKPRTARKASKPFVPTKSEKPTSGLDKENSLSKSNSMNSQGNTDDNNSSPAKKKNDQSVNKLSALKSLDPVYSNSLKPTQPEKQSLLTKAYSSSEELPLYKAAKILSR